MVSRCWYCENKVEEIIKHIFLTAPIAEKLWRYFANFVGIAMEGRHLQQLINTWWKHGTMPKLQEIYKAMSAFIMWTIWKRRNGLKHGVKTLFKEMVTQGLERGSDLCKGKGARITTNLGAEVRGHLI